MLTGPGGSVPLVPLTLFGGASSTVPVPPAGLPLGQLAFYGALPSH